MNQLHIHERICTSHSERVSKCVCWGTQHLFIVNTCACMVLRTPVWIHATLPAKNAHAPVHVCPCNGAEISLPWKPLQTYFEFLREHRAGCRLPPVLLLSRPNQSPDAVCSRNSSKSTLAHDAVAAAVSQASFDRPRWCRPDTVCLWFALALGRGPDLILHKIPFFSWVFIKVQI